MIPLDYAGTRKLQLITGQNGASVLVGFDDFDTTTKAYDRGVPQGTLITSATTTDVCATPASGKIRNIDFIQIKSSYAGTHVVSAQIASASGGPFLLISSSLLVNECLEYTHGSGWQTLDASGQKKISFGSPLYLPLTGGTISGATTFSAALTYGGVTLSNAVTGTGNMVLSASPTLTGTATVAAVTASGLITANAGETIASGQTLTLTGATVAGTPTWSSSQAITLSTAAQTAITSVGALNGGSITSGFGAIDVGADSISGGAISGTTGAFTKAAAGDVFVITNGGATPLPLYFYSGNAISGISTVAGLNGSAIYFDSAGINIVTGGIQSGLYSTTGLAVTGALSATTTIRPGGYTVGTLPSGTIGMKCYVTDAVAPAFLALLVGGGTAYSGAQYSATQWVAD
jgi:hypothetical protein